MKKIVLALVCMFALFAVTVKADNERPIQVNQLPQTAQTFIKQNFADQKVAIVLQETDFLTKVYEVVFSNGYRVEFDSDGNWKELECKFGEVPAAAVPTFIQNYVKENYPDAKIWKLELDKRDKEYDVKLSTRWEMKFNLKGQLIDLEQD